MSNVDFVITAKGNSRLVAVWDFFATPKGNLIAMLLAVFWLTALVLWPEKQTSEVNETLSNPISPPTATPITVPSGKLLDETSKAEPNLVCLDAYLTLAFMDEHETIFEGQQDARELVAAVAEFGNEADPSKRVSSLAYIRAHIRYSDAKGKSFRIQRGTWIAEEYYFTDCGVGESRKLIIAVIGKPPNEDDPEKFHAVQNNHESIDRYNMMTVMQLESNQYHVQVRLLAGDNGEIVKDFDFRLNLKPEFDIEIIKEGEGIFTEDTLKNEC